MSAGADPARRIAVIGAALDLGSGRRGVDMGPSAIRYAQLAEQVGALGYAITDHGNVETRLAEWAARVHRHLPELLPPPTARPEPVHQAMHYALTGAGKRVRA